MGDSVPKHTGPISLTDTHLEPSVSRTRPTTTRENRRRWKGLIPRDTQAACRFNCLASNSTPFFQIVKVMAAIFRVMGDSVPKHTGPISLTDTHLEPSVSRTRPTTP